MTVRAERWPAAVPVVRVWKPHSLERPAAVAEAIAARGETALYRAGCYLGDRNRYEAFCAFNAVMRVVAARIHASSFPGREHADASAREVAVLDAWHRAVSACLEGRHPDDADLAATEHEQVRPLAIVFAKALRTFPIAGTLWEDFFSAMRRSLDHERFATYGDFTGYAHGAAVSPTTIYLHVVASEPDHDTGAYYPRAEFDPAACGRELGLFGCLTRVVRDLRADLASGNPARRFLAADDMKRHGLTLPALLDDLALGLAGPALRSLVHTLVERARVAAGNGRARLEPLVETLTPDRAFAVEFPVRLHEAALDKIEACGFDPLGEAHRLTEGERDLLTRQVADEVAARRAAATAH